MTDTSSKLIAQGREQSRKAQIIEIALGAANAFSSLVGFAPGVILTSAFSGLLKQHAGLDVSALGADEAIEKARAARRQAVQRADDIFALLGAALGPGEGKGAG